MKARILTPLVVLTALFLASNATAQRRFMNPAYIEQNRTPHTVSVSLYGPSYRALTPGILEFLGGSWIGGDIFDSHKFTTMPGLSVDYRKMLNPVVSLGTSLGYSRMTSWYDYEHTDGIYCQHTNTHLVSAMFQLELTYLRRGIFTMYGVWELGFGVRHQNMRGELIDGRQPHTRFQPAEYPATASRRTRFMLLKHSAPLGFRFGRKWGGYIEFGLGYRDIIVVGADFQF